MLLFVPRLRRNILITGAGEGEDDRRETQYAWLQSLHSRRCSWEGGKVEGLRNEVWTLLSVKSNLHNYINELYIS